MVQSADMHDASSEELGTRLDTWYISYLYTWACSHQAHVVQHESIDASRHAQSVMGPECSNNHKGSELCIWWEHDHVYKYERIMYLDVLVQRGVERRNMHICRLYYYAPSLRCCWAFFGVVNGCLLATMQSSLPLWLFEHSDHITLCACLDALMRM